MLKNLTLSLEIHPNLGQLFSSNSSEDWTCFEFKERDDPTTVLATKLMQGLILNKKREIVYQKKQEDHRKEFFLDIAAGSNCFFIFCYRGGIYKKLLDDSNPTLFYKFSSNCATHGMNLRTTRNRKLLFMNKENKVYSTIVLKRDRIQARFDHRFIDKNSNESFGEFSISDVEFIGDNTLVILFQKYANSQKLGVIKYRPENRKVLAKNLLTLEPNKIIQSMHVDQKNEYLCCCSMIICPSQSRSWLEIYQLSPRLDSLELVARCPAADASNQLLFHARIISYL